MYSNQFAFSLRKVLFIEKYVKPACILIDRIMFSKDLQTILNLIDELETLLYNAKNDESFAYYSRFYTDLELFAVDCLEIKKA